MSRLLSSLRFQLIAIALISVLPAIALILYAGFEGRKGAELQTREDAMRLVDLASTHQAHLIDEAYRLLLTLSESPLPHAPASEQCSEYLQDLLSRHPHYLNLGVIGVDAKVLCSALPLGSANDFSDREYFWHAIESGGLAIGSSHSRSGLGKASIDLGYPLHDTKGCVNAVAFAEVDLAWLSDLAAYFKFADGATLTLIDPGGRIIARYPESERWVGKVIPNTGVLGAALDKGKGTIEAEGLDGVNRLYAFTLLDGSTHSLILYTGIPTSAVYAGPNRTLARNLIVLGVVTILSLLVAYLFGHLVVMRRVNVLIGAASRLAGGDLSARTGISLGGSELEQLGTAFDTMAESLEKQNVERDRIEAALRNSEEKYRSLVEQIPVVTYTAALDDARTILFISPQTESLLGFDQTDFYDGQDTWNRLVHEEDKKRVLEEFSRFRQEKDFSICEYRMLTRNNFVKWIRDEAVVVLNDAGIPLFIQGVMADITEQKRSQEALQKANKEFEMRVAQRTEALAKANEELRESAEKLKSFAASVVHDLKSPVIGTYGLSKLLWKQYGNTLDEKGMRYCDQIMKASEHVLELAETINAYIATKETSLHIEAVDLQEILCVLREEFSLRLAARSISWVERQTGTVVRADRLSLLRMFRNLIDNALKYGGDQLSAIRIEYDELKRFHTFSVSNDGRGVSEEDAEKIFEMFQRSSSSSRIEGAGLGLAIVKEIAEKHGGNISIKAGTERGVTFSCSISRDL